MPVYVCTHFIIRGGDVLLNSDADAPQRVIHRGRERVCGICT